MRDGADRQRSAAGVAEQVAEHVATDVTVPLRIPPAAGRHPAAAARGEYAPADVPPVPAGYRTADPGTSAAAAAAAEEDGRGRAPARSHRAARRGNGRATLLYVVVLVWVAAGFFLSWRGPGVAAGAEMVGGAMLAAALARLVLPGDAGGLLASRSRAIDVAGFTAFGSSLLVVGLVLPTA